MRARLLLSFVALCGFSAAALADNAPAPTPAQAGGVTLSVKADKSSVTYHIVHKFHKVDGVSKKVEGRVRLQGAGPTQVAIRVPVESFDSGNVNRDAHMKETVEQASFPNVEIKGVAEGIAIPTSFPATVQKVFHAQVTFHGVSQPIEIPVSIKFEAADRATATASFALSLDAFKVERPSLLFVKIDDALKIDASLSFAP
jgi:polyisoprenoid-binding protein YceI